MSKPKISAYGSWISPITPSLISQSSKTLGQIYLDGNTIYWTESIPSESGRIAIMKCDEHNTRSLITPNPFNVRTTVHEYGGGAYTVSGGTIYFSNYTDQQIYKHIPGTDPQRLTNTPKFRYCDYIVDKNRNSLLSVTEDHSADGSEPIHTISLIDLDSGLTRSIISGDDFYSNPRLDRSGTRLTWLSWNHPNMPWDGTQLWVATIDIDGVLKEQKMISLGESDAIYQPEWGPDGSLFFVSDRTGWWNIHKWDGDTTTNLTPIQAEFAKPQWVFGSATYGVMSEDQIIASRTKNGKWGITTLNPNTGTLTELDSTYPEMGRGDLKVNASSLIVEASSPITPMSLLTYDFDSNAWNSIASSNTANVPLSYISEPIQIDYDSGTGITSHANYYGPSNPDFEGPAGSLPPLIVKSHGGPTQAAQVGLDYNIQYWTSRGFAVVDVNYAGSTGYGTAYRNRLKGEWGVLDVIDCIGAALHLSQQGLVDPDKLCISGGSAGGYTTLSALTFHNVFSAGASYYGVSDLVALSKETHKFESRYLDQLVGPYPNRHDIYVQRSPIYHIDKLNCPIILFQGAEDKIVPQSQANLMYESILSKGIPVSYLLFDGEQHGFRRPETIKRVLEAELYFYSRIFEFSAPQLHDPVHIYNLDPSHSQ